MAALMLAAEAEEGADVLLLLLLLDDAGGAVTTSDLPVEYPIDVSVWASESTAPVYTICDATSSKQQASTTRARAPSCPATVPAHAAAAAAASRQKQWLTAAAAACSPDVPSHDR